MMSRYASVRPLLFATITAVCWGAPNPLAPLTASEMRSAAAIVKSSGRAPGSALFSLIGLQEPPKDAVLKQTPTPRRALAIIYDSPSNQPWEAVVDLGKSQIVSWR